MNRTPNEAEQNGRSVREICDDFCARLSELAANFGYEYVKSRCKIYKNLAFSRAAKTFGEFIFMI